MEEIARIYAQSLFEVARDNGKLDAIHEQLGQVADTIAENRDLQVFLFSPYFTSAEKRDGIARAVSGASGPSAEAATSARVAHEHRRRLVQR